MRIAVSATAKRRFSWAGFWLGFALAGFFDGILLHQILQWHHVLSDVDAAAYQDIRVQILADGLFHALMYVVAAIGLWLLWGRPVMDRIFWGDFLIGFGGWHILDAVLMHWVLNLHNIRVGVENYLVWDFVFFGLGLVLVALGIGVRRRARLDDVPPGPVAALFIALVMAGAGTWAALPPPGATGAVALFKPGTSAADVLAALDALDGRIVWTSADNRLWLLNLPEPVRAYSLYGHGAIYVTRAGFPLGCFTASGA